MNKDLKKIIVFDTGTGADLISIRLKSELKNLDFSIVTDQGNAPYGSKTDREILSLIDHKLKPHLKKHKMCVIACNTATVNVIKSLREMYPENIFFGIEPMIKTAEKISKTRRVLMLATEATKRSARYEYLLKEFKKDLEVLTIDTSGWAKHIDNGQEVDITEAIALCKKKQCDVIILGCSHYLALENKFKEQIPNIATLEPSIALARVISARLQPQ